jgi:hypothetical protein
MPATFAPITDRTDRPRLFDDRPASRSPGRLAAPDTTQRSRSAPERCPGPAGGVRNDDPRRIPRSGASLDDLIRGVWDELSSHRTVTCPVCHGQMAPRYGSAEQPVGGRCRRCGSSLG